MAISPDERAGTPPEASALVRECEALVASLRGLRTAPAEGLEELIEAHLRQSRALEERMETAADESGPDDPELERCRQLLLEAATHYGAVADRIARMLAELRERLEEVRDGGRALRSYQRASGRPPRRRA